MTVNMTRLYKLWADDPRKEKHERITLRTIAESSIKEAPVNDLLTGAFGYCLLPDAWLSAILTLP